MEIDNKQSLSEKIDNIDNKEEEYDEQEDYEEEADYQADENYLIRKYKYFYSEWDFSLIKNIKSIFKIIEKTTIRCYKCPLIPRIRINFSNSNINIECDNNHHYYYNSPLDFIKNFGNNGLEKKCTECKKSNINLYYDIKYNVILCDNCEVDIDKSNKERDVRIWRRIGGRRIGGRGAFLLNNHMSQNNNIRISLLEIDKCCIIHKKPIIYTFNLCEECSDDNNDYISPIDFFEFPKTKIKLKEMSNFLFTKIELDNIINKLDSLESKMNSLKIVNDNISLYILQSKSIGIVMIYFLISLMRSLIYTYKEMINNNYLNYNIISNLRRINMKDNLDINIKMFLSFLSYKNDLYYPIKHHNHNHNHINSAYNYFPFYNISMNKYMQGNISDKINKDDFVEENYLNIKKIFYEKKIKISQLKNIFDLNNTKIIEINNSNFFLIYELNQINYPYFHLKNEIYIQKYQINNNKYIELLDYQTIKIYNDNLNIQFKSISQDEDGTNI